MVMFATWFEDAVLNVCIVWVLALISIKYLLTTFGLGGAVKDGGKRVAVRLIGRLLK
jgi:hypothetical protein